MEKLRVVARSFSITLSVSTLSVRSEKCKHFFGKLHCAPRTRTAAQYAP